MNTFLHDLAVAHQQHEGWYPGSKSYRNNNPGNLRGPLGVFITFPTYGVGLAALQGDLRAKISGVAPSVQRYMKNSGKSYSQLVMIDYVSIYAPSADFNSPVAYCDDLCRRLGQYNIQPSTPLSQLNELMNGTIDRIPDTDYVMPIQFKIQAAENALRWATPMRARMLLRLIARLQQLI